VAQRADRRAGRSDLARQVGELLRELFLAGRVIPGLNGIGFEHVLAMLGPAVIAASRFMVGARIGVHPNHAARVGRRNR